jgi:hypothetical protein
MHAARQRNPLLLPMNVRLHLPFLSDRIKERETAASARMVVTLCRGGKALSDSENAPVRYDGVLFETEALGVLGELASGLRQQQRLTGLRRLLCGRKLHHDEF